MSVTLSDEEVIRKREEGTDLGRKDDKKGPAYLKVHSVGVRDTQSVKLLWVRDLHGFGLVCAREAVTTGQLYPSTHHTTISVVSLLHALVIGDDEVNMVEDIGGTFLHKLILKRKQYQQKLYTHTHSALTDK